MASRKDIWVDFVMADFSRNDALIIPDMLPTNSREQALLYAAPRICSLQIAVLLLTYMPPVKHQTVTCDGNPSSQFHVEMFIK